MIEPAALGMSAGRTDPRPLFGEQYRRRKTDPAARPGNDDVLVDYRHNGEFVVAVFIWEVPLECHLALGS